MPQLSDRDAQRLRAHAPAADTARALHPRQRALVHRRDWLRLLAPRAVGGAECPLPEVVRLEEAIARADGSCGWVVTLCAGAGWFAGFLAPDLARELMATRRVCLAGSGAPTGRALRDGEGWRLSGRWTFASGAPIATHFTLNAQLHDADGPCVDERGDPLHRAFVLDAAAVRVVPSWRSVGLRASGTHAFEVDDAWLPDARSFRIAPDAAVADGPLWRFPFAELAWATLAANVAGIGQGFLQEAATLAPGRPRLAALLDLQQAALAPRREAFYALLDAAWAEVVAGRALDEARASALREASAAWVHATRRAVDEVYPACGLWAAHEDSALNRIWRDLHTATQHALLVP